MDARAHARATWRSPARPPMRAPLLEVKRIHADAAFVSLLRLAPVIDAVEIDAPIVRVSRVGDGSYDVDDVLQHLAAIPPSPEPARFAIHNIVVRGGGADFVDRPLATTHRVRELELAVPFVSSLPSEREIKVEPHLAFALDGSRFDSAAAATPFAERGNGEVQAAPRRLLGRALARLSAARPAGAAARGDPRRRSRRRLRAAAEAVAQGLGNGRGAAASRWSTRRPPSCCRSATSRSRSTSCVRSSDASASRASTSTRRTSSRFATPPAVSTCCSPPRHRRARPAPVARVPLPTSAASVAASAARGERRCCGERLRRRRGRRASPRCRSAPRRLDWRDATTSPAAALALDRLLVRRAGDRLAARRAGRLQRRGPARQCRRARQAGVLRAGPRQRGDRQGHPGRSAADGAASVPERRPRAAARRRPERRGRDRLARRQGADADRGRRQALALAKLVLGEAKSPEIAAEAIELADVHVDTVARSASVGRIALRAPRVRVERDAARRWAFERYGAPGTKAPAAAPRPAPAASADERRRGVVEAGRRRDRDRARPRLVQRPAELAGRARRARSGLAAARLRARQHSAGAVPPRRARERPRGAERQGGRQRRRRQHRRARRAEGLRGRPARRRTARRCCSRTCRCICSIRTSTTSSTSTCRRRRPASRATFAGSGRAGRSPPSRCSGDATVEDFRATSATTERAALASAGDGARRSDGAPPAQLEVAVAARHRLRDGARSRDALRRRVDRAERLLRAHRPRRERPAQHPGRRPAWRGCVGRGDAASGAAAQPPAARVAPAASAAAASRRHRRRRVRGRS